MMKKKKKMKVGKMKSVELKSKAKAELKKMMDGETRSVCEYFYNFMLNE